MPDELRRPENLAKRIVLWRRELDQLRSEAGVIFRKARDLTLALENTQREETLRPLVQALPTESDEWLYRNEPDPRGASAEGQPRQGGKFAKKEKEPSKE